jgi:hypothetical protein
MLISLFILFILKLTNPLVKFQFMFLNFQFNRVRLFSVINLLKFMLINVKIQLLLKLIDSLIQCILKSANFQIELD